MAGFSSKGTRGTLSEINVTPLVDVMLVLLVIFMVTAPMLKMGVDVDLPKAKAKPIDSKEDKLVLTIKADRSIYLGDRRIPIKDLETKLKTNAKLKKDKEIYLHADRSLEYGFVVKVMAIIKNAGIEKMGIVTDPLGPEKRISKKKGGK